MHHHEGKTSKRMNKLRTGKARGETIQETEMLNGEALDFYLRTQDKFP
jgi:hypothetical protein